MAWIVPLGVALAAFATPMLGAKAYDYLLKSDHFLVREVLVDGNHHIDYATIQSLSGIAPGLHVLSAGLKQMEVDLVAHPWVARAEVRRELPGRLVVSITEHSPIALIALDHLMLADTSGTPFAESRPGDGLDLPIITGLSPDAFSTVSSAAIARGDVRAATNIARLYDSMGLANRFPIAEVRVEAGRSMTLVLSGTGTEAVLGMGPYRGKLYRLEWILENLHAQGKTAEYVLLDGGPQGLGQGDDGRVVVKADLTPSPAEQAERARLRTERARAHFGIVDEAMGPGAGAHPGLPGGLMGLPSLFQAPTAGGTPGPEKKAKGDAMNLDMVEGASAISHGVQPAIAPIWPLEALGLQDAATIKEDPDGRVNAAAGGE